ncbi:hypothetical protein [Chryseolinea lacunae]|uniref:GlsB/YeaQ/YmgE family stress response membrane protein n=1 Tax=Chryseolinea lacunae TaxID=2801331 RepID=A0ABS1KR23_9BACT|nr:hypothetical protein [Chryseolinea lacunae]MBL0741758.1 hypothetical protein [Chryseolinea lacunae]
MQSRGLTTVLIVLLFVFTFPIWIGIAGALFGVIVGLFGAVFGIIGGIFGAIFGMLGALFGWAFGWHWPFGFHWPSFTTILIIALVVALISRSRKI